MCIFTFFRIRASPKAHDSISGAFLGSAHSSNNFRIQIGASIFSETVAHYSIQVRETEPSMSLVSQVILPINFTFFFHQKLQLDHYTSEPTIYYTTTGRSNKTKTVSVK